MISQCHFFKYTSKPIIRWTNNETVLNSHGDCAYLLPMSIYTDILLWSLVGSLSCPGGCPSITVSQCHSKSHCCDAKMMYECLNVEIIPSKWWWQSSKLTTMITVTNSLESTENLRNRSSTSPRLTSSSWVSELKPRKLSLKVYYCFNVCYQVGCLLHL